MTCDTATVPKVRESSELARWSPIRNRSPWGTIHECWSPWTVVGWGGAVGGSAYRYGSSIWVPLMKTWPSWMSTVSPPSPMTRLMNGVPSSWTQSGRRREHDDVAPLVGVEAGRQLVDQDVLLRLQRVLHRLLLDLVRLGDERLDDEEDDERESERLRDLEETPEHGSSGHKTRSIGCCPRDPPEVVRRLHNEVAKRV